MVELRVSVVIPAYNAAATIAAALGSVTNQTVLRSSCGGRDGQGMTREDLEILVADDGSSDGTADLCDQWLRRSGFAYKVLRGSRNEGPASARNRAVAAACGEWVAFLDADDKWLPWRLEAQFSALDRCPGVGMICGGRCPLEEDGDVEVAQNGSNVGDFEVERLQVDDLVLSNRVSTSTVLVARREFDRAGGFDERFRGPEDFELWLRLASKTGVYILLAPLAAYRMFAGSLSMDERRFLPQVLAVLDKAFGSDGVLAGKRHLRRGAWANQYWNAAWMAYSRGARWRAVQMLLRGYVIGGWGRHGLRRRWGVTAFKYVWDTEQRL